MSVTEIQLYKTLQAKLGDAAAQEMVNFIKSEINSEFMDCKQVFLVKEDKVDLIRAGKQDKVELIYAMKQDKVELINIMKQDKADIMRAIYLTNVLQYLALIGSLIGLMSFFMKH